VSHQSEKKTLHVHWKLSARKLTAQLKVSADTTPFDNSVVRIVPTALAREALTHQQTLYTALQ